MGKLKLIALAIADTASAWWATNVPSKTYISDLACGHHAVRRRDPGASALCGVCDGPVTVLRTRRWAR